MPKEKRFAVVVTGVANMVQRRTVMATSKKEAEEKAKATVNNEVWAYDGIQDETIRVGSVRQLGD